MGKYVEAIDSYDRALSLDRGIYEAWFNKACAYSLSGQVDLALRSIESAIQAGPAFLLKVAMVDPNLELMRQDKRFLRIIREAQALSDT